jgi:guanylate kinase
MSQPLADPAQLPHRFTPGGFLMVLSGPSGAGKGTLVERLLEARPDCIFAVSSTTRPMRSTETDGVEYRFVSREAFEARIQRDYFLEWAEVHGNLYGTPAEEVANLEAMGRVVLLDVDVQGGESVRRIRPDAVSVFVYPPSLEALRQRLARRGTDGPGVVARRLANAPGEMAQYAHYDYLVVNDNLEQAVATLIAIHDAERARVRRLRTS